MLTTYNNLEDLHDAFINVIKQLNNGPDDTDYWWTVYIRLFNDCPHINSVRNEGLYKQSFNGVNSYTSLRYIKDFNIAESFYNLNNAFKDKAIIYRQDIYSVILTENFLIYQCFEKSDIIVLDSVDYVRPEIMDLIVDGNYKENTFYYVTHSPMGFRTTEMEIKKINVDLKKFYNDDLPHQQILDFLKSDKSGLIMLHGEPGGGKTSYIRQLISLFPKNKFLAMDSSVFNYITDSSFIQFLLDYQNHIIILEDCENMITENRNSNISSLLNLTDGLLGDGIKLKFICTFNTDTRNIDKALLRKGRLKVKYEFKKLAKEKVETLNAEKNLGLTSITEMTLAELFNNNENNGVTNNERKSIGF